MDFNFFTQPEKDEDIEHLEAQVVTGNYLEKIQRYYALGVVIPGENLTIHHQVHCSVNNGKSICDCKVQIYHENGLLVIESLA